MESIERYGQPYWACPHCPYGSFDRAYTEAHQREHEPRQSLDELLARETPPEVPAEAPVVIVRDVPASPVLVAPRAPRAKTGKE